MRPKSRQGCIGRATGCAKSIIILPSTQLNAVSPHPPRSQYSGGVIICVNDRRKNGDNPNGTLLRYADIVMKFSCVATAKVEGGWRHCCGANHFSRRFILHAGGMHHSVKYTPSGWMFWLGGPGTDAGILCTPHMIYLQSDTHGDFKLSR